MVFCKNCGVELEADMQYCPLCGRPVNSHTAGNVEVQKAKLEESTVPFPKGESMNQPQRKVVWEVVAIVLACISVATCVINLIIDKRISWSEYPIAICLIAFAYVSVFAFWAQRTVIQIIGSFLAAGVSLLFLDHLTGGINWAFTLAVPLLAAANFILVALLTVIRLSKQKGVNLIAYGFLAAALLCICIEAILAFYADQHLRLRWSFIVSACVLPVSLILLLTHHRYKKGRNLEKTFHI